MNIKFNNVFIFILKVHGKDELHRISEESLAKGDLTNPKKNGLMKQFPGYHRSTRGVRWSAYKENPKPKTSKSVQKHLSNRILNVWLLPLKFKKSKI